MNYLAHLYFGKNTSASLVGNLMGDFIKGNEEALRESFPSEVVDGILMHRKIDKFTDSHPDFIAAKMLLSSHIVKYAGIIIDVIFDHFLSKHWNQYGSNDLRSFCDQSYKTLEEHSEWHSEELKKRLPSLIKNDAIFQYQYNHGVEKTLQSIADRSKRCPEIIDGYMDFIRNYNEFELIFHSFFPSVKAYAQTLAPTKSVNIQTEPLDDAQLILLWKQPAVMMAENSYRFESLAGHFISKGVSREAANKEAKSIIENISNKQIKQAKFLLYPAYFFIALAPLGFLSHWILPNLPESSHSRSFMTGLLCIIIAMLLINRSKTIR